MAVAVCYVASAGYLFQTALSALQARQHSPDDVPVYIVFLTNGGASETEAAAFETVLERHGVDMLRLDASVLEGLHPSFGRYFVGAVLPDKVDRLLYLDGDTQILESLDPLLETSPPTRGVLACRDPMVLLHELGGRQRTKIERWWDQSGILVETRDRYVNSGVFVVDRSYLPELARDVRTLEKAGSRLVFSDQDALNLLVGERICVMPTCWNFPGFLLGTAAEAISPPRVVHFMSRPRPWNARLRPWGIRFYEPYARLARDEPELRPYWHRFGRVAVARYVAQQTYKEIVERRMLSGPRAEETVRALERSVDRFVGA